MIQKLVGNIELLQEFVLSDDFQWIIMPKGAVLSFELSKIDKIWMEWSLGR